MWFNVIGCIVMLTLSLLMVPLVATAQAVGKLPRIGVLVPGLPTGTNRGVEAFRQGLRDLGCIEDQTIALEVRWDEHTPKRWPKHAAALVRLPVGILVAGGINAIVAAQHATTTIPIVMAAQGGRDPVEAWLVASLARPGENITGVTLMTTETTTKRFEFLHEVVLACPAWPSSWMLGTPVGTPTSTTTRRRLACWGYITAYELRGKPLTAYRRRQRRKGSR